MLGPGGVGSGQASTATQCCSRRFEYLFNFDNTFEIHDDIEVLKRMGMACGLESGNCSAEDLKVARSLVPKVLEPYVTGQHGVSSSWSSLPIAALPATPALLQTGLYSTISSHTHNHILPWPRPQLAT